ncbi:CHAP domain-containing protein [Oscillibacter sp. MSJ-31]|uniref:CHAP domain-containing protein n=1 Tax=Oscillibacter sp. MSJ-31 TaxID=2841526 RepID=UPI00209FB903|nr:CHAP domain-containing protein [Oscillibacter sp. MSJ-31]
MAQAHGQWVTKGYRPGDVLIYDLPGTAYKTDHCGICESVSGQYVTAIEGNTSNGNTGSQSNGDGVYRRKRKMSLVLGAYRPKYTDYRAQLQKRAGVGGQDDGLPRGVQVRQRPDPQAGNDEIICPIRANFKRLCPAWAQPYP